MDRWVESRKRLGTRPVVDVQTPVAPMAPVQVMPIERAGLLEKASEQIELSAVLRKPPRPRGPWEVLIAQDTEDEFERISRLPR